MFWGGYEGGGGRCHVDLLYVGGMACLEFLGLALSFASRSLYISYGAPLWTLRHNLTTQKS